MGAPTAPARRLGNLSADRSDDPELHATLTVLADRALVRRDDAELRLPGPLWSAFPHPLGLVRAEQLPAGVPGGDLRAPTRALALPPARGQRDRYDSGWSWRTRRGWSENDSGGPSKHRGRNGPGAGQPMCG